MAGSDSGRGGSDGPNSRPLNDTVAQSGPGIPDDAASDGYDPVADAQADREEGERSEAPGPDTLFNGP
jgi:hypothetical protein